MCCRSLSAGDDGGNEDESASGKVNLGRKINLSKRKKSSSNWWCWGSNLETEKHAGEKLHGVMQLKEIRERQTEGGKAPGTRKNGKKIKTSKIYGHYAPEIHWFAICLLHLENSLILQSTCSRIGFLSTTPVSYCSNEKIS